jgi:hypothetical protein
VPITIPAPILTNDDPDYVWDVFYHRAGLPDDYDTANVATLYVHPTSRNKWLEMTFGPAGRVYLGR